MCGYLQRILWGPNKALWKLCMDMLQMWLANLEPSSSLTGTDFTNTNRYSSLEIFDTSSLDPDSASLPQTSTPTSPTPNRHPRLDFSPPSKNRRKSIKTMIINCNGLKSTSKRSQLQALIDHHRPDVLLGCESKLASSIPTHSIFPSNYNVFRKDRNEHGEGYLLQCITLLLFQTAQNLTLNVSFSGVIYSSPMLNLYL